MMRGCMAILLLAAVVPALAPGASAGGGAPFYYFDPDTKLHDFGLLKTRFQEFLHDDYSFQPFLRENDLLREIPARPPRFLIVSAERAGELEGGLTAVPLLVPEADGRTAYRKKLLMRRGADEVRLVAGTLKIDMGETSRGWSWVIVAKDLDALLAVALGQVDAAIVDPGSISLLRSINPDALARLAVGEETRPIYHPPLCFLRGVASGSEVDAMRRRFLAMDKEPGGRELLLLLGFDRWTDAPGELTGGAR